MRSAAKWNAQPHERRLGANLGLYSITLNNDMQLDLQTLEAYKAFRLEAERKGFRHFLEVFDPNASGAHSPADLASLYQRSHRPPVGGSHGAAVVPCF